MKVRYEPSYISRWDGGDHSYPRWLHPEQSWRNRRLDRNPETDYDFGINHHDHHGRERPVRRVDPLDEL